MSVKSARLWSAMRSFDQNFAEKCALTARIRTIVSTSRSERDEEADIRGPWPIKRFGLGARTASSLRSVPAEQTFVRLRAYPVFAGGPRRKFEASSVHRAP